MKSILALCLLTVALAASSVIKSSKKEKTETLIYENYNNGSSTYWFRYKLSDGTEHFQRSIIKDNHRVVVKGKYTYVGPGGIIYNVKYIADENGYRAEIEEGSGPGHIDPALFISMIGG